MDGILKLLFTCFVIVVNGATQECGPPDVPEGGTYKNKKAKYQNGDWVTYSCDKDLLLVGKEKRMCNSGTWTFSTPFCDSPTSVVADLRTSSSHKASVRIREFTDENTRTCYPAKSGNSIDVYFRNPTIVHLIRLYLKSGNINITVCAKTLNSKSFCIPCHREVDKDQWVLMNCSSNLTKSNLSSIKFNENQTVCEIQVYEKNDYWCDKAPDFSVPNGYFEVSRNRATLHCKDGFRKLNWRTVCENSRWQNVKAQCEEILCDTDVDNSSSTSWEDWHLLEKVSKLSAGVKRQLTCMADFEKQGGPEIVTCLNNGSWTYTTGRCVARKTMPMRTIVPIAVGSVVSIVILVLLGVMIYLIKKKWKREVVVVYKPGSEGSTSTVHDYQYAACNYYEPVEGPPSPPSTERPTLTKRGGDGYLLPVDSVHRTLVPKTNASPADIAFGTLKESVLYNSD